jgi:hypothetical protein
LFFGLFNVEKIGWRLLLEILVNAEENEKDDGDTAR